MQNECERQTEFDGKSVALVHEAAEQRRNQVIEREMSMSIRDRFKEMIDQRNAMVDLMDEIFEENIHYGEIIKGKGYSLLQAGAEFLGNACRIFPRYKTTITPLENGHREYRVICELRRLDGFVIGEAESTCTTKESRHLRQNISDAYHNVHCAAMKRAHTRAIRNTLGITDALKAMLARRAAMVGSGQKQQQAEPKNVTPPKKQPQPAAPYDPQGVLENLIASNHAKIEGLTDKILTKKEVAAACTVFLKGDYSEKAARKAEKDPAGFIAKLAEFIRTGEHKNGAEKAEEKPVEAATGWGGDPIVESLPEEPPFGKPDKTADDLLPPEDPQDAKFNQL